MIPNWHIPGGGSPSNHWWIPSQNHRSGWGGRDMRVAMLLDKQVMTPRDCTDRLWVVYISVIVYIYMAASQNVKPRSIPKRRWSRPFHTSGSPRADPYPNFDATPYIDYNYIYAYTIIHICISLSFILKCMYILYIYVCVCVYDYIYIHRTKQLDMI